MHANRLAALIAAGLGLTFSALAADPNTVKNKTYDGWVSQSFAGAPFTPFHDCFSFTATQMCSAGCGECGTLSEKILGGSFGQSLFVAQISCGGLNLVFSGQSVDAAHLPGGIDAIGGVVVGGTQATTFGFEGLANSACTLAVPAVPGKGGPYGTKTK